MNDESGQNLVEYALLALLIGFAAVASLTSLSNSVAAVFRAVTSTLVSAA